MAASGRPAPMRLRRKVALLGFRTVGKSSLLSRFVSGAFDEEYEPTIIDSLHRTMTVEGKEFDLEIVDSAGQDEFSRIPKEASIGVHGYILVYDVTSVLSFRKVQMINDTLLDSIGAESVPRVLVATKIDLAESVAVSRREGLELARRLNCPFIEVSARTSVNVSRVFELLLREIEHDSGILAVEKPPPPKEASGGCVVA